MPSAKKAIVLGADNQYMDKLETTIKSVSCYNKDIKFYVFNDDLPTEWFQLMNKRLEVINSEVINVKLTIDIVKAYKTPNPHINYATFFRYFIADYVSEDLALYLDSDLVVTENLDKLFAMSLDDNYLAAVPDIPSQPDGFNAGVLLVNVTKWRQEAVSHALIALTNEHHEHAYGDQEILNMLFAGSWLPLDLTYNLQVGFDAHMHFYGNDDWYTLFTGVPAIIHYTTVNKPWSHARYNRFREIWWFYYGLNWNDVLLRTDVVTRSFKELVKPYKGSVSVFTASGDIEGIEELLQQLPDVQFHIAAPTLFAPNIISLQKYTNLYIYPCVDPAVREGIIEQTDLYLDINYGEEVYDILDTMKAAGKPIFGFTRTSHDTSGYSQLFEVSQLEELVQSIRNYLQEM